jgi:hypothetical protein
MNNTQSVGTLIFYFTCNFCYFYGAAKILVQKNGMYD